MAIEEVQQHIVVCNLIAAIEAALLQQQATETDTALLSKLTCDKLQFDFPSCSTPELQALSEELCRGGNTPGHLELSCRIVTNIVEGAAVLVGSNKHDGVKLSTGSASPDRVACGSDTSGDTATADGLLDPGNTSQPSAQSVQQAYSQLAAAVLISLVSRALAQPEEVGWPMVGQLHGGSAILQGDTTASTSEAGSETAPAPDLHTSANGQHIITAQPPLSSFPATTAHTFHPVLEALESDEDDFIFEDIEPPASHHNLHLTLRASPHGQQIPITQHVSSPYSSNKLLQSLLWLSSHVSYSLLGAAAVFEWHDVSSPSEQTQSVNTSSTSQPTQSTPSSAPSTPPAAALLSPSLLRVICACTKAPFEAASLLPLLCPYTTLIADSVVEHPQCTASLQQLWTILVPSGTTYPTIQHKLQQSARPQSLMRTAQSFPGLALELASGLCSRLMVPAAKAELWRQIHAQLLPALLHHLQDLTRATAKLMRPLDSQVASRGQSEPFLRPDTAPSSQEWSTSLDSIQHACPLVSFYLQQAPRNAQPSQQLLDAGLIGPLALLWIRFGFLPPAEPLRVAALLAASGSPAVLRWMLAVPGFINALSCSVMCEGGVAAEHGCIWQLLLSDLAGSAPTSKGSGTSTAAAGIAEALAATGRPDRAERLLLAAASKVGQAPPASLAHISSTSLGAEAADSQLASGCTMQSSGAELAEAHALLQLLAMACELSPRTASMLTFPLAPALKQLETALRSSHGSCSSSTASQDISAFSSTASVTESSPASCTISDASASSELFDEGVGLKQSMPDNVAGDMLKDHHADSEIAQASRHSKGMLQLRGSAMKLIKTLLTSQGKTD